MCPAIIYRVNIHVFIFALRPVLIGFQVEWVKVTQSCLTLCDYTVHVILQARILEWGAIPFSRGSSQPRDWIQVSCIAGKFFTSWATRETLSGASGKKPACQSWRHKRCLFYPWVRKIPWRMSWQPTLVYLPGEPHGQRNLAGYSP